MQPPITSDPARLGLAIALPLAAAVVRAGLPPAAVSSIGPAVVTVGWTGGLAVLSFTAVLAVTWLAGVRAGVLAAVVSAGIMSATVLEMRLVLAGDRASLALIALESAIAAAAVVLAGAARRADRTRGEDRGRQGDAHQQTTPTGQLAARVEAIEGLASDLAVAGTPLQVADRVLRRTTELVEPAAARLHVVEEETGRLALVLETGRPSSASSRTTLDGDGVAARAARQGRLTRAGATAGRPGADRPDRPDRTDEDVATIAVPLLAGDRAIGAVELAFDPPRALSVDLATTLLVIGRLAGSALERSRLRRSSEGLSVEAAESAKRVERLSRISADLAGAPGPEEIGELLVGHGIAAIGASSGLLAMPDPADPLHLRAVHARGYPPGLLERLDRSPVRERTPMSDAFRKGQPVVVESPEAWRSAYPGMSDQLAIVGARSLVALPVTGPDGAAAVLVLHLPQDGAIAPDDLALLDAIARQGGQALERARLLAQEREARELQEAFIGVVSHELRTPLTTVYGGTKILARSASTDEATRQELIRDIEAEADRLYRLVEDLLVLSRVERGNLVVDAGPVQLGHVVNRVLASERRRWPGHRFEATAVPAIETVAGEETYIEQVIRNLLTNAAKYSPSGSTITVTTGPIDGSDGEGEGVSVRVEDEGPGIEADEADRLFTLFYRSPSTAQAASGAGIGLFVCRRLVEAMGGHIWARPRDGGGSEFGFTLRTYADDDGEIPEGGPTGAQWSGTTSRTAREATEEAVP